MTRMNYLTKDMMQKLYGELVAMTSRQHAEQAAALLAGDFKADVFGEPKYYHWVAPSPEQVARAQAHATVALAIATQGQAGTAGWTERQTDEVGRSSRVLQEPAEPNRRPWWRRAGAR